MSTLEIREQTRLGLARIVHLTATGIRYRLFRSIVSVIVIAVAVAFFTNVLSASLLRKSLLDSASRRVHELRQAAQWAARLSHAGTLEEVLDEASKSTPGGTGWSELQGFGGFEEERMQRFAELSGNAKRYLNFFNGLGYGTRRALVRAATGTEIFDRLQGDEEWERFRQTFENLRLVRFPGALEEFRSFLDAWPALREQVRRVLEGRASGIRSLRAQIGGRSLAESLADANAGFGQAIRDAGFHLPPEVGAVVADQAESMLASRLLEESILDPDARAALATRLNQLPDTLTARTLWELLNSRDAAAWYLGVLRDEGVSAPDWEAERVAELASMQLEQRVLRQAERLDQGGEGGFLGMGQRVGWLLIISMLVCVVGITNAMLMSVTERFREIATLKCLGALDGSIMGMFVLEACLLGLVGGFGGAVAGVCIGFLRTLATFGGFVLTAVPVGELVIGMLAATGLGVILAGLAAIFPSYQAARLAPMEAMRIE